jgi:type IV pilus assembly protein PilB
MDALRVIPEEAAARAQAVAFDRAGMHLSLAMVSPENPQTIELLNRLEQDGYTIEKFMISHTSLEVALARYADLSLAKSADSGVFVLHANELAELESKLTNVSAFKSHLDTLMARAHAQTSTLLEEVLAAAFAMKASDVHIEPEETQVRMRLRLDGILEDAYAFDAHTYHRLLSRIKLLSGLKLNITDRAQDGRFSVDLGGSEIEVRTSLIPGGYGESVVLRILNPEAIEVTFDQLGIHPKLLARLATEIKRPNGMLLTTGPTGSGKTTTLYAFLRYIHTPDIKVITIEDPIEYHLEGIVQTQTNGDDYTFASGLRSILRQDPDVMQKSLKRHSRLHSPATLCSRLYTPITQLVPSLASLTSVLIRNHSRPQSPSRWHNASYENSTLKSENKYRLKVNKKHWLRKFSRLLRTNHFFLLLSI